MNEGYNLIVQRNLGREIPTIVQNVIQALLNHIRQILRQHLGCFCLANGRNSLAGFRNFRKLAGKGIVDDLFVKTMVQHNDFLDINGVKGGSISVIGELL